MEDAVQRISQSYPQPLSAGLRESVKAMTIILKVLQISGNISSGISFLQQVGDSQLPSGSFVHLRLYLQPVVSLVDHSKVLHVNETIIIQIYQYFNDLKQNSTTK